MPLVKSKLASRSLTIRAAAVTIIASVLPIFGIKIAPDVLPALESF